MATAHILETAEASARRGAKRATPSQGRASEDLFHDGRPGVGTLLVALVRVWARIEYGVLIESRDQQARAA